MRDVEACLHSRAARAYQMGIRGNVTRTNLAYANEHRDWQVLVVESRPVDETVGLRCVQTIRLNSRQGRTDYPDVLRRISNVVPESGQALVFLANHFDLAALVSAQIYRRRWSVELFWRWLKQHLRLRGFFSNDPNGVRVQIWMALCAYLLVAVAGQRKHLKPSVYEILQVVSVSSLEHIPLEDLLMRSDTRILVVDVPKQ